MLYDGLEVQLQPARIGHSGVGFDEYFDPSSLADRPSAWVAMPSEALEYVIYLQNNDANNAFKASIAVDGQTVPKSVYLLPGKRRIMSGWPIDGDSFRPFQFRPAGSQDPLPPSQSPFAEADYAAPRSSVHPARQLPAADQVGQIQVRWQRVQQTGTAPRRGSGSRKVKPGPISGTWSAMEGKSKGVLVTHQTSFGAPQLAPRQVRNRSGGAPTFDILENEPVITFTLRYRCKYLLQDMGIADLPSTNGAPTNGYYPVSWQREDMLDQSVKRERTDPRAPGIVTHNVRDVIDILDSSDEERKASAAREGRTQNTAPSYVEVIDLCDSEPDYD